MKRTRLSLSTLVPTESETGSNPHRFLPWTPEQSMIVHVRGHTTFLAMGPVRLNAAKRTCDWAEWVGLAVILFASSKRMKNIVVQNLE